MEDRWNIGYRLNEDRITLSEMSAQIINEAPEILFFRAVVEWKKDKIGGDKKDEEEKFEPKEPSQIENLCLNSIEGKKEHNKKEGKEIDKISRSDEMGDIEQFAEEVEPSDRENEYDQEDKSIHFILRENGKEGDKDEGYYH
jgi:hypothetical protein